MKRFVVKCWLFVVCALAASAGQTQGDVNGAVFARAAG